MLAKTRPEASEPAVTVWGLALVFGIRVRNATFQGKAFS